MDQIVGPGGLEVIPTAPTTILDFLSHYTFTIAVSVYDIRVSSLEKFALLTKLSRKRHFRGSVTTNVHSVVVRQMSREEYDGLFINMHSRSPNVQ